MKVSAFAWVAVACALGCGGGDKSAPGGGGAPGTTGGRGGGSGGSGGAPGSQAGATGGGGGANGGSGGAGTAGSGGAAGAGTGGSAGAGGAGSDAAPTTDGSGAGIRPARVLIYTKRSTTTHDASIPVAVKSLSDLFKSIAIEVEASEVTTMFTAANLARFGGVVMVNSNGAPFGMPGTSEGMALLEFVRGGGGLAAFHAAANTTYPASHPLLALLGATFQSTGGGVRDVTCAPEGQHPAAAKIPSMLAAPNDETYEFGNLDPMNQVILRCDPASGATKMTAAWVREEGAGRVFYSTLGHGPGSWTAGGTILTTHAWPGILWVFGRAN